MPKRLSTTSILHKLIALLLVALVCPLLLLLLVRWIGWRIQFWMILLLSAVLVVGAIRMSMQLRERLLTQDYAFETMPDGLILLDNQLHADYVNPAAREILQLSGLGPDHAATVAELFLQHERLLELWDNRMHGRSELQVGSRHLEVELLPMDIGGRRTDSLVILRDVTERTRYEQKLIRYATVDSLTNLYNRRYFLELLEGAMKRWASTGGRISLALIDVDYFKRINDRHGHLAGDRVLQHFAALLREMVGERGVTGRIGGEEFAVYWMDTDGETAYRIMEQLRLRVLEEQIGLSSAESVPAGHESVYTISAGIAELDASHATLESWLAEADACLYASKQNGRNRTTLARNSGVPAFTAHHLNR